MFVDDTSLISDCKYTEQCLEKNSQMDRKMENGF